MADVTNDFWIHRVTSNDGTEFAGPLCAWRRWWPRNRSPRRSPGFSPEAAKRSGQANNLLMQLCRNTQEIRIFCLDLRALPIKNEERRREDGDDYP